MLLNQSLGEQRRAVSELQAENSNLRSAQSVARDMLEELRRKPPQPRRGLKNFAYACSTSMMEATCTLTNTQPEESAQVCLRGVVKHKGSSASAVAIVVCSGEVKPRATVHLSAPYTIGAVRSICPAEIGVDWDKCEFNVDDVTDSTEKS